MRVATHVSATIASVARAMVIGCVAFACAMLYLAGTLRRLAIRDPAARTLARQRQCGRLLRSAFTMLGATPIKVGQVMSSRPDVFSPAVIDELRSLQDRVPPFSARRVRAILERELGGPLHLYFRELDDQPVAAGSIAQVHRAVLLDGNEVAIKVLRPGVRACVRRDARLVLWLAHVVHLISPRARSADALGHARGVIAGIIAQTDLLHEASNYEQLAEHFADTEHLQLPQIYRALSTRDVLVMEFIRGTRVDEIRGEHVQQVTRVVRSAFFAMCFEHGLVHADLHPGNLLVRDNGDVVLLDVGLVKQLAPDVIEQITDFARCLVIGDACDLVRHLQTHHDYLATIDWHAVEVDARAFVATLRGRSMFELEVSTVVGQLFALARKHHIRPMAELALVLLGMVTIEGIAKRLDPSARTFTEVAKFLAPRMPHPRLAHGSIAQPLREARSEPQAVRESTTTSTPPRTLGIS